MTAPEEIMLDAHGGAPEAAARILHLAHSSADAELVAECLRAAELPFMLDRVSTRAEFTEAVESGAYDLILADHSLPSFDGAEALAIARGAAPATPFIFVSGVPGEDHAVDSLKQGATDYVVKQRLRKLPMAVTRALAEARAREERERIGRELRTSYRALRESEERLCLLMSATASMMWNADAVGRFTRPQPGFEVLTGGRFEEYRGWTWLNFIHPADRDRMRAAWRTAAVERSLLEIEHRVRFRDASFRHVLTRGVPILGPEENGEPGRLLGWIGASSDIERRKRAEEALRHAQKMEAVGQLTGGIAHDFNNLLTVVMGGLDLILRQIAREGAAARPERIRGAAENAMQGARRAATLTHRLLAFSRRQALDPRPIDANRLVLDMSDMLRRTLGENVALRTELADGLWPTEADPNQLENAVLNLAVNARDAMPEGGRLSIATANAELAGEAADGMAGQFVTIAVSDTGTGMDGATAERAFEPFFTTKDVGQGTGLGLSQVYGFVRQSSGHVRLESAPGRGTTVRIYLPRRDDIGRGEEAAPPPLPAPLRADGGTVLVVEGDAAVREYSTHCMRELGYAVIEAPTGAAALDQLERNREIGLLFTDIGLPGGMNGRELAEAALRRRPGLKVLFTSGYALPPFDDTPDHAPDAAPGAAPDQARRGAAPQLLAKPFTAAELAVKLRQLLGTR